MRSPLAHALAALVLVVALHAPASTFGQPNREFMLENGPRASRSSLFVLSFPSGREVHLLLENRLGQYFDESIALTAEENLAGTTPLRVELEAGLPQPQDRPLTLLLHGGQGPRRLARRRRRRRCCRSQRRKGGYLESSRPRRAARASAWARRASARGSAPCWAR